MQDAIGKIIGGLKAMSGDRKNRECCVILYSDGDCSIKYPGEQLGRWVTIHQLASELERAERRQQTQGEATP